MSKVGNLFGRSSRARGVGGGSPPGSASSLRSGGSGGSREATPPSAFSVESVNGSPLEGQDLGQPDLYYIFAAVNDCYEMMEKVRAGGAALWPSPLPPHCAAGRCKLWRRSTLRLRSSTAWTLRWCRKCCPRAA